MSDKPNSEHGNAPTPIRLLLVEDNPADARLITEMLGDIKNLSFQIIHVERLSRSLVYLEKGNTDIVLLDMNLTDSEWPHTMLKVLACAPEVPVVILSGFDDEERAIKALKKGVQDYLVKGEIDSRLLGRTILHAIERKRIDKELKLKQKQLEELNRTLEQRVLEEVAQNREKDHLMIQQDRQAAMGEMIGNIAHQWRQPLNTLGLLIQDLLHAQRYGELQGDYLEKSVHEGTEIINHMSQTIDDFRNFFRPEKEKEVFRPGETLQRALSFVEASFRNDNIPVILEAEDYVEIKGYANEYAQVLLNILNNAKDVLLEREIADPHVTIRLFSEEGRSVVTITDNAGGIREEVLGKIFEPYFTTKEQGSGTGIGLYMSKTIIEKNMQGKLTARNTGDGAEFRIEV
jgi:signal transduction histidine kinase